MKDLFVVDMLRKGEVKVIFEKTDGTERVMNCTLNLDAIPSNKHPKGEGDRKQNDTVQPVFDLDVNEWRSFRWNSVKKFEFED